MSADIGGGEMAERSPIEWFFKNAERPLFTNADVLAIAGGRVSPVTLQNWTNREYIRPTIIGHRRMYMLVEAAAVILAQPLVNKLHVEPSVATATLLFAMGVLAGQSDVGHPPIAQIRHQMVAFQAEDDGLYPEFFDERKPGPFKDDDAFIVMPLGRLLDALATEMQGFARLNSSKKAHVKMAADRVAQDYCEKIYVFYR
jgi:hypothetical protein